MKKTVIAALCCLLALGTATAAFVEEAEPSTDMINHPSQHERLTLPPMMPLVKATAIKEV